MIEEKDYIEEVKELSKLGYRVKSKKVRYIYNKSELVGHKLFFEVEKKIILTDEN